MDLPRRIFAPTVAAFAPQFGRVTKSAAVQADGHTTPPAVLTYPVRDRQGDVVEPGGLDLWEFENVYERLSNFEHGPYIGTTQVEFKSMPRLNGQGQPDESLGLIALPVGVTTFFEGARDAARHTLRRFDHNGNVTGAYTADECAKLADHLRPLVPGVYGGVSLEFRPDGPEGVAYKSLGPHPLLKGRPALHFFKSKMIGLASACDIPVNQFAGYCPPDSETLARAEKALKYCESSGSLAVIRKSLSPLVRVLKSTPSGRVSAPVRRTPVSATKAPPRRVTKAEMYEDDETALMEPPPEMNPDVVEDETAVTVEPDGDEMKPTPAALFQFAQALKDACAMADDMAAKGEHMQGVKALKKFCEQVDGIAAKVSAMADKVAGAVAGDDVEIDVDADMEADAPPVEMDETGGLMAKSFGATKWRPRRFIKASPYTLKQVQKAKTVGKDETEKLLEWAMSRIDELEGKRAN